MAQAFKLREYPELILRASIHKLKLIERNTLLSYRNTHKNTVDRHILILIFENKFD